MVNDFDAHVRTWKRVLRQGHGVLEHANEHVVSHPDVCGENEGDEGHSVNLKEPINKWGNLARDQRWAQVRACVRACIGTSYCACVRAFLKTNLGIFRKPCVRSFHEKI